MDEGRRVCAASFNKLAPMAIFQLPKTKRELLSKLFIREKVPGVLYISNEISSYYTF